MKWLFISEKRSWGFGVMYMHFSYGEPKWMLRVVFANMEFMLYK